MLLILLAVASDSLPQGWFVLPPIVDEIYPLINTVFGTRPNGGCPDAVRRYNDQNTKETATSQTNGTATKAKIYATFPPWLLSFDMILVNKNYIHPEKGGHVTTCCNIWKGIPEVWVNPSSNEKIRTIYIFQTAGSHRQGGIV